MKAKSTKPAKVVKTVKAKAKQSSEKTTTLDYLPLAFLMSVAVLVILSVVFMLINKPSTKISNFAECVASGRTVMETFPEQCRADGVIYTDVEALGAYQ